MSTMSLDLTTFNPAMKEYYSTKTVENLVYKDNPFLALVPKQERFPGRNLPIPAQYSLPQGRSQLFSQAQAQAGVGLKVVSFLLTRVHNYAIATIDNETMLASEDDAGAFMDAAIATNDGAVMNLTRALARDLYRSGFGELGVVGTINGAVMTLATGDDIVNFEVDQVCVFALATSGQALRNSGAGLTVLSVDRSAGAVTFTASISTETGTSVGDVVFTKGDKVDASTRSCMSGLAAWLPDTTPAQSESYFGVDRSVDSTRLAGLRWAPPAGTPLDELLVTAANRVGREGGRLTHYFMSFANFDKLVKIQGQKVQIVDVQVSPTVGFQSVRIMGGRGAIDIIPDHNCPGDHVYGLDMSTWKLYSIGKAVQILDNDSLQGLRQATADGIEMRWGFYGNLGCSAPGRNISIKLAD